MNKKLNYGDTCAHLLTKFSRIMRLMILMLILGMNSLLAASAYSQLTKITLKMSDSRIEEVLNQIESKSEFYFLFDQKQIDINRKVSINVEDEKIAAILDELFAGTEVKHVVVDRQIVLTTSFATENQGQQQGKQVAGKVTDSSGSSLPGVSVVVKGTTTGVITDGDGKYSLTKVPENAILQFSFVGMKTQEIKVGTQTSINVTLADEAIGLEEVVAVGYGTQKKRDVTGSVASARVEELKNTTPTSLQQALKGKVSGLQSMQSSGDPTSEPQMLIRGMGSLGTNNGPLVIVNGIPGSFGSISPNDIESVEVLKDASATAIYGSRGTNGVVIVTTKKAVKGESKVDFQAYTGTSNAAHVFEYMDKDHYIDVFNQSLDNALFLGKMTQAVRDSKYITPALASSMYYKNVPDLFFQSGTVRGYNFAASTANEQTGFRVGGNYDEIGGITGLSESQVKVYIYLARVFLKEYIGSLDTVI